MKNLRRIDVLLNEDTLERFDSGDVVKIITIGTYGREYLGKITWIDTLEMNIDMSDKFNSNTKKFKYEDIQSIKKCL